MLSTAVHYRRSPLRFCTFSCAALLALLWLIEYVMAERHWSTMLFAYAPQYGLILAPAALAVICLRHEQRKLALSNSALLVLAISAFGDIQLPLASLWRAPGLPASELRVLTYNIHHGIGGTQNVARVVREQKPDIVCLQEASATDRMPDPVPELKRHFNGWEFARLGELVIFSRLPLVMQSQHLLRDRGYSGILQVTVEKDPRMIDIFNIHVACPITRISLSDIRKRMPVRERQIESLLQAVAASPHPAVIAGDFNTPPRGLLYRKLAGNFTDAQRSAHWGMANTFHSTLPYLRIDYLWLTKGLMAQSCRVVRDNASDHRAVVADVMLTVEEN